MKRHKARLAAVVVVRYLVDEFRVVGRAHGNTGFVFTLANWTDHSCSSFRLLCDLCASAFLCVRYLPRQTLTQRSAETQGKLKPLLYLTFASNGISSKCVICLK